MKHADFVHLHNHSDYSLLDGASSIPGMVLRAAELGMPALALTDHGSLFGAVEFYQEARKAGVKPILGMEAYVTRGSRRDRTRDTAHHLVLLARDEQGFRNLIKLSSYAFLEGFYYRPRVDHELLASHAEGLVALSACPKGEVATDLLADDEEGAARTAAMYRDIFGADHYFLEIQNHGLEIEDRIRDRVTRLSRRTGIPLVATNDCHYLRHEHAAAHDVLLCIQTGKNVDDAQRMRYETDQVYFKSAEEMRQRFADQPDALANTLAIAERCNVAIQFGRPLLPEFPLPEGVESAEAYLRELAWKGVEERYRPVSDEVRQRFEYELDVICRMGFASYFLIVRDFIRFAREQGIGVGPGRGSVAGSLIAYALRITDIDPLQHHLIFERFLNPERVSMPDIDIDFDDLRRGEVIDYVKRTYGEKNVTQIITFGTMGAKGVIRDVGRALGLAFAEVDKIAKLVPDGLGMTLERALELSGDLRNLPQRGPQFGRLLDTARVLEGLARHASTHAAGVLITPGPVMDHVPLYRQKDESVTTQWDMKAVEKIGLLKMDFLGLRTLSVLQEAERLVRQHRGVALDVSALPGDDPLTFERVFQTAETVGIFQFESSGMRDYLRRLKPTVFDDLVAMNALYRPGPMENIPYFIDCKHGRQVARYEHPDLEPILKSTYGVFVYQEQVMQAANVLAGFSMAQADELRRAMGKKRPEEMDAKRQAFVEGARHRRIASAKAEKIFATMEKFAGYGFNRSHSAAYAQVAYQSAYLKAHHPAEFMAATLTSEMSDSSRIVTLIEECRRLRLALLPPDVNRSEWKFTLEDGAIRFGLGAVRNVGQAVVDAIVSARAEGGAFKSLFDFASRLDARTLNRRVLESLIAAGACDALGAERAAMFAAAERALSHASALHRERQSGQSSLFGEAAGGGVAVSAPALPLTPPWSGRERSTREKEVLGFYLTEHPLEPLRDELPRVASHTIAQALEEGDGAEVRLAGILMECRTITTRTGRIMAAITLEDLSGRVECTVFPDTWEQAKGLLVPDEIVVLGGRVEVSDDRGTKLLISEARRMDEARALFRPVLHLEVGAHDLDVAWMEGIDEILSSHPGDAEVYLLIVMPDRARQASRSRRFRVAEGDAVVAALRQRFPGLRVWWGKGAA
jgi:DNA polymerase-3 subunit alpha